jgi:hypothetical protein
MSRFWQSIGTSENAGTLPQRYQAFGKLWAKIKPLEKRREDMKLL